MFVGILQKYYLSALSTFCFSLGLDEVQAAHSRTDGGMVADAFWMSLYAIFKEGMSRLLSLLWLDPVIQFIILLWRFSVMTVVARSLMEGVL